MAGIGNANTTQTLAVLSDYLSRSAARERETASGRAMAERLADLGFPDIGDPQLQPAEQIALLGTRLRMNESQRLAAEADRKAREAAAERRSLSGIANVRGDVGSELPETLIARLRGVPFVGTAEERIARGDTIGDIRTGEKRLETARLWEAPFETTQTFPMMTPRSTPRPTFNNPLPEVPLTLGAGPLDAPPISLTTVPENAARMSYAITRGVEPKPGEMADAFDLPLRQLPGGVTELQKRVKPPFAPYTIAATDPKGNVTPIVTTIDPDSGEPRATRLPTQEGVAKPERLPRPQSFERLESLGAVIAGRPELALPEHRKLTPTQAQQIRNVMGQAEQQVSPNLAAAVVSSNLTRVDTAVRRLENKLKAETNPRLKASMEADLDQLLVEQQTYRNELARYTKPGPVSAAPSSERPGVPAGVDVPSEKDLDAMGVLLP